MDPLAIISAVLGAISAFYAWRQYKHLTSPKIPDTDLSSKQPQPEESSLIRTEDLYSFVGLERPVISVRPDNKKAITKKHKDKFFFYTPNEPQVLFNPFLFVDFIRKINRMRMIVLWGNKLSRNDKNQFARALAYNLRTVNDELRIFEWKKNTDFYDIPVILAEKEKGIYLLTDIAPQMVQSNFEAIQIVVQRKSHFLIITTNIILDDWLRFTQALELFQEITAQKLYDDGYLALNLVELLAKSSSSLPLEIKDEFLETYKAQKDTGSDIRELVDFHLSPNRSLKYVAKCLGGYDDLERFVRSLCGDENRVLNDAIIDKIVENITIKDFDFLKWYYRELNEHDRLLLLGIALFSGLYENQLFAVIGELIENKWRMHELTLHTFYHDGLNKLMEYVVVVIETGEIEKKIEIKPHLRKPIFYECWYKYGQLIKNSIYGMMDIVKESIDIYVSFGRRTNDKEFYEISETSKKYQLYGTSDKIRLIHRVVGSTLRLIAYKSPPLVEQTLFFCACERDIFMRYSVALSLAQWEIRENESGDNEKYKHKLYQILNRWYKEPEKVFESSGEGLSESNKVSIKERKEFYYSTIILTIGFAATYDRPNQCSIELLKILKEFISPLLEEKPGLTKWEAVEGALGESTTPLLIKYHLAQLHNDGLLYDIMHYASSIIHISDKLSLTYKENPQLFNSIIDRMNDICEKLKVMENKHQKKVKRFRRRGTPESKITFSQDLKMFSPRERLMLILIATYGSLAFIDRDGWLTAQETFQRLKNIFKSEPEESKLRDSVAEAVGVQIGRDFHNLREEIKSILVIFNLKHYLRIIPSFYPMILKGRKELEKKLAEEKKEMILEDSYTELDEDALDPDRKITEIEKEMFDWILKGGQRFRLIGFLALFSAYLTRLKKEDQLNEFDQLITKKTHKKLFYGLLITPICLFGLGTPLIIVHLLPIIITLGSIFPIEINEILRNWRTKVEERSIRRLGWVLSVSLFFANHFALIVTIYLFIGFVIWGLANLY